MRKILVVDDDADLLFSVTRILRKNDFTVTPLSDCTTAIQVALTDLPDIILLDVNLGECDGREICRELKNNLHLSMPVLLFSANGEYAASVTEHLADGFIQKPFDSAEFIHLINEHVTKQSAS